MLVSCRYTFGGPNMAVPLGSAVFCKGYHDQIKGKQSASYRSGSQTKSKCPGWASDPVLRRRLLDEALIDPEGGDDSMGRPRRLYNALGEVFFVATSTNEQDPRYDCYPEIPLSGSLRSQLLERAERTVDEFLSAP